ncbi:SixA phosphatase family protein [Celeribacter arenosi]|uniref:Histidine phosphatase family protein n=1 Tax=Celeribacter arenosi TaxID=792649 RepID=A0ABP7K520_9RHOB
MPLRLIVMRHAKSSWDDPLLDDYDRVLNARGRRNAQAVGMWLRDAGYAPDQVLFSAAARTTETCDLVCEAGGFQAERTRSRRLYHASAETILEHVRRATGDAVMVIGHNPGIADFAARFAVALSTSPDFARYPTAATTVFDVVGDRWEAVGFGKSTIIDFTIPASLQT